MAAPILTVLMTVRNGEPYLHEAVASILSQTYSVSISHSGQRID